MTVNPIVPRLIWAGNGATSSIALSIGQQPITFRDAAHFVIRQRVLASGAETLLTLGVDYNISGGPVLSSSQAPATLSRIGGVLPSGSVWAVTRASPISQEVDIAPGGNFSSTDVEAMGDRGTEATQDLKEALSRALVISPFDASAINPELPKPTGNGFLGWNAAGTRLENKSLPYLSLDQLQQAVVDAQNYAAQATATAAQIEALRVLVEGVYDAFDDRYLGQKPSSPTTDNDGQPLQIGAIYFNTTSQQILVYTTSGWVAAYIPSGDGVDSFNGRTGAVTPTTGDYNTTQITGLQAALDAKAPTTHDHATQNIIPNTLRWTRASQLSGAVDLDTVLTAGFYDVSAATNKPPNSTSWGYLLVEVHSNNSNFAKQTWTDLDLATTGHWIRTRVSGVWGPWQRTQTAGKQTLWVPATAFVTIGASPTLNTFQPGGALGATYRTLDFDPNTEEVAFFGVQMPKSWNLGQCSFRVVWSHAAAATNFGVEWHLYGTASGDGDSLFLSALPPGGVQDTGGIANTQYTTVESGLFTIDGSPAVGDMVTFRIGRASATAFDTLAIDARLHGLSIFYTTNAATDA